jgi:hypothetical protein
MVFWLPGIKAAEPATYNFDERELNSLGYTFIRSNKLKDAIRIFQLNVQAYPRSSNAYDSLAEAHMDDGDKTQASPTIKRHSSSIQTTAVPPGRFRNSPPPDPNSSCPGAVRRTRRWRVAPMADRDDVRRIALSLPRTREGKDHFPSASTTRASRKASRGCGSNEWNPGSRACRVPTSSR